MKNENLRESQNQNWGQESGAGNKFQISLRRRLPSTSKNAEGSEAFSTQAKLGPAGKTRRAGRPNQTLEPLDVPPQAVWQDDFEAPPMHWWMDELPTWEAPELDLGDGRVLVLDATDPSPADYCPEYSGN